MTASTKPYLEQFKLWMDTQNREKIFKSPTGGFRINTLFFETNIDPDIKPIFTTKSRHYKDCWSFPLLYREIGDLVEWKIGNIMLYDYKHFLKLSKSKMFRDMFKLIRQDLEAKIRSEALQCMINITRDHSIQPSVKFGAARFLAKNEWKVEDKIKKPWVKAKGSTVDPEDIDMEDDLKLLGEQIETRSTTGTN